MGHAGFDTLVYPGIDIMEEPLDSTNLEWCGFYLAPAPSQPDTSWMASRQQLLAAGWGFAPLYVGQQEPGQPGSHNLTTAQGAIDGDNACVLAKGAGFPKGSAIFLDIEQGGAIRDQTAGYLKAWAEAVEAFDYRPGVYCSHSSVESIDELNLALVFLVWKVKDSDSGVPKQAAFKDDEPSNSSVANAEAWQWAQNCTIPTSKGSLLVDLDTAETTDPSTAAQELLRATPVEKDDAECEEIG